MTEEDGHEEQRTYTPAELAYYQNGADNCNTHLTALSESHTPIQDLLGTFLDFIFMTNLTTPDFGVCFKMNQTSFCLEDPELPEEWHVNVRVTLDLSSDPPDDVHSSPYSPF